MTLDGHYTAANKGRARRAKKAKLAAAANGAGKTRGAPITPHPGSPSTAAPHSQSSVPGSANDPQPIPRHLMPPHGSLLSRSTFRAREPSRAKIAPCNHARNATTAAAPPNRARPLPHASLFPGGRRQRAPRGWPGNEDAGARLPHSLATPHRRRTRSRSAMVAAGPWAATAGRGLSPGVSVSPRLARSRLPGSSGTSAPPPHRALARQVKRVTSGSGQLPGARGPRRTRGLPWHPEHGAAWTQDALNEELPGWPKEGSPGSACQAGARLPASTPRVKSGLVRECRASPSPQSTESAVTPRPQGATASYSRPRASGPEGRLLDSALLHSHHSSLGEGVGGAPSSLASHLRRFAARPAPA